MDRYYSEWLVKVLGNFTLQCAYCGSEDIKLSWDMAKGELETMTIKCKCGKWLVKDGIMGHKAHEKGAKNR
jgi:hypothetical protein